MGFLTYLQSCICCLLSINQETAKITELSSSSTSQPTTTTGLYRLRVYVVPLRILYGFRASACYGWSWQLCLCVLIDFMQASVCIVLTLGSERASFGVSQPSVPALALGAILMSVTLHWLRCLQCTLDCLECTLVAESAL